MEYPSGHHSRRHHRRDDDDGDGYDDDGGSPRNRPFPPPGSALPPDVYGQPPPPRPPFYGGGRDDDFGPPPPPRSNVYHTSHSAPPPDYPPPGDDFASGYPPPPQRFSQGSAEYSDYPPPPPSATVEHVAHEVDEPSETGHHSYRPHLPSFLHHHTQHQSEYDPTDAADASGGGALGSYFANKPTYKVYCKAEPNYSLAIRDSKVILAPSDSSDPYQKWYKDEKFSTRVKDEDGFPCFSLVNKATGEAIKHSVGASHPVQLVSYNPEQLDASVLWTAGKVLDDGYRTVRMVNNVRLNLDAFHADAKSGGVHDGTTIVLWQWNKGDNQRWKITPYCKFLRRRGEE